MKRLLPILSLLLAVMLGGCTAMMESSSYGSSDLYITDNRIKVAEELKAKAEAERAEAEARKAMWEARLAEAEYYAATEENYSSIVADDYESAYARRLYGFQSPTYRMPSSYYNLSTSSAMRYASAYDPAFYNIMVSGDQVWVEPKYVTSMFGSWGATNVTFGLYASPWAFGWGIYADPFYYTMWGYPHYSWYDWNWHMCYNPYHWGYYPGYYPGYCPHYHPHYHPHYPGYYPPHYGGDGGGGHRHQTVVRRNVGQSLGGQSVGARYPQQGTISGGSNSNNRIRRVGGTVTGSGQYRGSSSGSSTGSQYRGSSSGTQYRGSGSSSTGTRTSNSFNRRSESNSMSHSGASFNRGSSSGGYSGGYSGGGNSSGGSHGGGQIRR
jgi:hypothetical protein